MRAQLVESLALLEAWIDFPEEDIPETVLSQVRANAAALETELSALLAQDHGEKIRDGFHIVLLGAPNAGKSSLLNALARRDAAIVSHEAGTTRDIIELQMDIGGYAVTLSDTAGIRETQNAVEAEGVKRALDRAEKADLRLVLVEKDKLKNCQENGALLTDNALLLITKCDNGPAPLPDNVKSAYAVSVKTGFGLPQLLNAITDRLSLLAPATEPSYIARPRHRAALEEALSHIRAFMRNMNTGTNEIELWCEDLRMAARALGRITGAVDVEELLDEIFSRFCIGK
jgi:tRNA modification GTPase